MGPAARPARRRWYGEWLSRAPQRWMKFWAWPVDTEDWKAQGSGSPD